MMSGVPLVTPVVLPLYDTNTIRYGIIRISVHAYKYKNWNQTLTPTKQTGVNTNWPPLLRRNHKEKLKMDIMNNTDSSQIPRANSGAPKR